MPASAPFSLTGCGDYFAETASAVGDRATPAFGGAFFVPSNLVSPFSCRSFDFVIRRQEIKRMGYRPPLQPSRQV